MVVLNRLSSESFLSPAETDPSSPPMFEQLEPRLLLSVDSLLPAVDPMEVTDLQLISAPGAGTQVASASSGQDLQIVADGQSNYVIFRAGDAAQTVVLAAIELNEYIAKATGVVLPITTEADFLSGPVISLGDTYLARDAGFDPDAMELEQFRMVTHDDDLYIFGCDTLEGERTELGGQSAGTLWGVYAFLEDHVGVRWLFPGDLGEDVPELDRIVVSATDYTDEPFFLYRKLPYTASHLGVEDEELLIWHRRQRLLPYSRDLWHEHNQKKFVPLSMFDEHPEWFPLIDGQRVARYNVELTNDEVVRRFADVVLDYWRANDDLHCYSISPEDMAAWSESAESMALWESAPAGFLHGQTSYSKLVANFYNEVARLVGQEFPDRVVAGYAYSDHLWPVQDANFSIEPNVFTMVAMSPMYGFGLLKGELQDQFDQIMSGWSAMTDDFGYYDLPSNWDDPLHVGAPNPACLEIIEFVASRMVQYQPKGIYLYGEDAWGVAGALNYLYARLMWNPDQDFRAVAGDYFERMYGPEAGTAMEEINTLVEARIKEFSVDNSVYCPLRWWRLRGVYGPIYQQIEDLYLQAKSSATEGKHIERLGMFERNLVLLRWIMKSYGMIDAQPSPIDRTSEEVFTIIRGTKTDRAMATFDMPAMEDIAPDVVSGWASDAPVAPAPAPGVCCVRGNNRALIWAAQDGPVQISIVNSQRPENPIFYRLQDAQGTVLSEGLLTDQVPVGFDASGGASYFLDVFAMNRRWYHLGVEGEGAAIAIQANRSDGELHLMERLSPVYFYVPEDVSDFEITLRTFSPGETVAADLISPSGRICAQYDTTNEATQTRRVSTADEQPGFWALSFSRGSQGAIDDVFVTLDEALSPWVFVDPARPIIVQTSPPEDPDPQSSPVLEAIADRAVTEGSTRAVNISASDADGDGLTLSAAGLPHFVTFTDNGDGTGFLQADPTAGDTGTYPIIITVTDDGDPVLSDSEDFTLTVIPSAGPDQVVYRVNAGGSRIYTADTPWEADTNVGPAPQVNAEAAAARTYANATGTDMTHPSIPEGTPKALFEAERWDTPSGEEMQWDFAVDPGEYEVRLHFAEIYVGAMTVGGRVFDVRIEDQLVLDDYDVYADVGGRAGVVKSFAVTSDGNLDIDFAHVVENPAIKGIEILRIGGDHQPVLEPVGNQIVTEGDARALDVSASDADGDGITLSAAGLPGFVTFIDHDDGTGTLTIAPAVGNAGTYAITITAADDGDPAMSDLEAFTLTVLPAASENQVVYRVNAGGSTIHTAGIEWEADTNADTAPYVNAGAGRSRTYAKAAQIDMSDPSIPEGTPEALFQVERWDAPSGEEMQWDFAVDPGRYEVRLYFAEIYTGAMTVGGRIFDVRIEDQLVLDDYDVYAEVGAYAGVVESFVVTSDGNLDIDFAHVVENPAIKGIEIIRL